MEMSDAGYAALSPKDLSNFGNPLRLPGEEGLMGALDASDAPVRAVTRKEELEILPGRRTELWVYGVEAGGRSYANPTYRVRRGSRFSAELLNDLDAETTIHWHGLGVPAEMDGHPTRHVRPGQAYRYGFSVDDAASTYWYHPHAHGGTALQTYRGLAGLFLVEDEGDDRLRGSLGLRFGETEVPLVIQDRTFDDDGRLVYDPDEAARFMGVTGETVLVNLTPTPFLEVARGTYRFRILNASNARTYQLAFADGRGDLLPFGLVGTDGGRLEEPRGVAELFLSPGERADVLVDLGGLEAGDVAALKSLSFDPMHNEHEADGGAVDHAGHGTGHGTGHGVGHGMGHGRLGDGEEFYVLRLNVTGEGRAAPGAPTGPGMAPGAPAAPRPVDVGGAPTRIFALSAETGPGGMRWLINGLTYDIGEHPVVVERGAVEVWEYRNDEKSMPHPMHVHGFDQRVLERRGSPEQVSRLAVDDDGTGRISTDLGRKDTVTVWPGETVRVAIDFSHGHDGEQLYLLHCHVLEHEDQGMMLNFKVVPPAD